MIIKKCFIWGATGQYKVIKDILNSNNFHIECVFDNNQTYNPKAFTTRFLGGWNSFLEWTYTVKPHEIGYLIAIGGNKGKIRLNLQNKIKKLGYQPLTIWHKTANISSSVIIGEGSQILMGTNISVEVKIGKSCIINTGSQIDHECLIGDGVHIMPGSILAGCVKIDKFATIGSGAVILPRVRIGEGAIIGAGAIVTKNVDPYTTVIGIPAKPIT